MTLGLGSPLERKDRITPSARQTGIEYARAWRLANKPKFDAIYGAEPRCAVCDQPIRSEQQ